MSDKKKMVALLLLFIWCHRFYVGKIGSGILFWLTCGGVGIWSIVDFVRILTGKFEDAEGRPLEQ